MSRKIQLKTTFMDKELREITNLVGATNENKVQNYLNMHIIVERILVFKR